MMSLLKHSQKRIFLENFISLGFLPLSWFRLSFCSVSCCCVPAPRHTLPQSLAFGQLDVPSGFCLSRVLSLSLVPDSSLYLLAGCLDTDPSYYSTPKGT